MHPYARPREPRHVGENWARALLRPVSATNGRTMYTLADVRGQILAMPPERQNLSAWHHATGLLMASARTESVDIKQVTVAVEMALHRDGRLPGVPDLAVNVASAHHS